MTQTFGLKLGNDQSIDKFFKLTVETTRKTLNCDRVIIYSASKLQKGLVLAESVNPKYPSVLRQTIQDPFLSGKYLEMYSYGMPVAIDNIYISEKSKKDLKNLERLGVKSLMIAPIAVDDQLLALLVAHQCSKIQLWHHEAVIFLTEKANSTGFALSNNYQTKNLPSTRTQKQLPASLKKDNDQIENLATTDAKIPDRQNQLDTLSNLPSNNTPQLKPDKSFNKKVEEVRRILNCDRVVVYRINQDNSGMIVAESVATGCTTVQNQALDNPCFETQYLEQYRNGKIQAINNIHKSDLSASYIQQLEKIKVKAILVTPIINDKKLFGLLVAHQCSNNRQWQQLEIFWLAQIAKQFGFTIDHAQLVADAQRLRQQAEDEDQWTEYLTTAIQHIRQSLKTEDILHNSVSEIRKILNCDRAVVYHIDQKNKSGIIVAESVASGWIKAQNKVVNDPCFESQYLQQYRNGKVRAINNIYDSGLNTCYIEQLEKLAVKANVVAPIICEGELFGILVIHQCSSTRQWQQVEIRWLAQISTQIGFALDNAKVIEQLEPSQKMNPNLFQQKYEHTEAIKYQIVNILGEKGSAYQNLSQEAIGQSETTIDILYQIQKTAESLGTTASHIKQVKFQRRQGELTVQNIQEHLDRAANNMSNLQSTVQNVAMGFDNFINYCQQLVQLVNTIKDLSKQIVNQSMSVAKTVNLGQIEAPDQSSIVNLSETIFALMQQLFEITAQVDSLFANIQTEVKDKTLVLESGTEELIHGIREFQSVRQELSRVMKLNDQMNHSLENIAESIETHINSSTFTNNSIQDVAGVAERIAQQSKIITQSFQQLAELVQQL